MTKPPKLLVFIIPVILLFAATILIFRQPAPSIMIVTNGSGSTAGGTEIVITGSGFTPKTRVLVGGRPAASSNFIGPRTILAKVPPASPGTVAVTVINPDGRQASVPDGFTYSSLKPVITSINPDFSPVAGGFTITLKGHGFRSSDVRVKVDDVTVSPAVQDDSNLSFVAPAMNGPKQVNVSVVSSDGIWASDKSNLNYR